MCVVLGSISAGGSVDRRALNSQVKRQWRFLTANTAANGYGTHRTSHVKTKSFCTLTVEQRFFFVIKSWVIEGFVSACRQGLQLLQPQNFPSTRSFSLLSRALFLLQHYRGCFPGLSMSQRATGIGERYFWSKNFSIHWFALNIYSFSSSKINIKSVTLFVCLKIVQKTTAMCYWIFFFYDGRLFIGF